MKKRELAEAVAVHADVDEKTAAKVLDAAIEVIYATVAKGEDVALTGFAKFSRVRKSARTVRNPRTGGTVRAKAKNVAKITPMKTFKDVAQGLTPAPKLIKKRATPSAPAANSDEATAVPRRGRAVKQPEVTPATKRAPRATKAAADTTAAPRTRRKAAVEQAPSAPKRAGARKIAAAQTTDAIAKPTRRRAAAATVAEPAALKKTARKTTKPAATPSAAAATSSTPARRRKAAVSGDVSKAAAKPATARATVRRSTKTS